MNNPQSKAPKTSLLSQPNEQITPALASKARVPATNVKAPEPSQAMPGDLTWRIILHIGHDTILPLMFEVKGKLLIGRSDPSQGFCPNIDLQAFGGQEAGVSRRHAELFVADKVLYIRDLRSTNGTVINGARIEPEQSYKLREGDEIDFGQIHMRLHCSRASK